MNSEEKVQQTIHDILFQYGPKTANKLCFLVKEKVGCTEKTALRHVHILEENGKVKKSIDGQKHEYSLPEINNNDLNDSLSKFLDHLLNDFKKEFPIVMKRLKKRTTKKYTDLTSHEKLAIYYAISDSINLTLNWSKMISLMIIAGFSTTKNRDKAKEIQKLYNQALQELFALSRKIHQPIGQELFIDVLNDIKPGLGTKLSHGKRHD